MTKPIVRENFTHKRGGPRRTAQEIIDLIHANIIIVEGTGCWEWTRSKDNCGYAILVWGKYNNKAHRHSYTVFRGTIPDEKQVCHRCDNPACVNPDHLFLGDYRVNTDDKIAKNRQTKGEGFSHSKLTERAVLFIRNMPDMKITDLARMFGASATTVRNVRQGKTWKYLANGDSNENNK